MSFFALDLVIDPSGTSIEFFGVVWIISSFKVNELENFVYMKNSNKGLWNCMSLCGWYDNFRQQWLYDQVY